MYYFDKNKWIEKYSEKLTQEEVNYIIDILKTALENLDLIPEKVW
jgi:hypothetical protein